MAKEFLNRFLKLENSIKPDVGQHCDIVSLSVSSTLLHMRYVYTAKQSLEDMLTQTYACASAMRKSARSLPKPVS